METVDISSLWHASVSLRRGTFFYCQIGVVSIKYIDKNSFKKMSKEGALQICEGMEFQRPGAATPKPLHPGVRGPVLGTESQPLSVDRRLRDGV